MPKLSDTQAILLAAAAERPDGCLLPLPGSLRGGAAKKVIDALLARGFVAERISGRMTKADPAMNRVWRNLEDGRAVLLFITAAGAEAIGVDAAAVPCAFNAGTNSAGEPAAEAATGAYMGADAGPVEASPKPRDRKRKSPATGADVAPARKAPGDTKQAQLIAMLRRPEGATIAQIVAATGWQPHYADARIMPT